MLLWFLTLDGSSSTFFLFDIGKKGCPDFQLMWWKLRVRKTVVTWMSGFVQSFVQESATNCFVVSSPPPTPRKWLFASVTRRRSSSTFPTSTDRTLTPNEWNMPTNNSINWIYTSINCSCTSSLSFSTPFLSTLLNKLFLFLSLSLHSNDELTFNFK